MANRPDRLLDYEELQAHSQALVAQAYGGNLPECSRGCLCEDCPILSHLGCPIAGDTDFIALLEYYSSRHEAISKLREKRIDVIAEILRRHKLAMHWELLARIAMAEDSTLFPNDRSVLGILSHNPEMFREESSESFSLV